MIPSVKIRFIIAGFLWVGLLGSFAFGDVPEYEDPGIVYAARYLTAPTRRSECSELLKNVAPESRTNLSYANTIAARTLLVLTLDHPDIIESLKEPGLEQDDLLSLFHGVAGFSIRPRAMALSSGFLGKDPTAYTRFVKDPSRSSSIWPIRSTKVAPKFEEDQGLIDRLRDPNNFKLLHLPRIQKLARTFLLRSVEAWKNHNRNSDTSTKKKRPARAEWTQLYLIPNTEVFVDIKLSMPFSPQLVDSLHSLTEELYPKEWVKPLSVLPHVELLAYEANKNLAERQIVAERARELVVDFLVHFFPDILAVRDSILESYRSSGYLAAEIGKDTAVRKRIRNEILKLGRGEELTYPEYARGAKLLEEQQEIPKVDIDRLYLNDARSTSKDLRAMDLEPLEASLATWWEEKSNSPLENTRFLLPIVDKVVDVLPRGFDFRDLKNQIPNTENLASNASQLQSYLYSVAEGARRDFEKLSALNSLLASPIESQISEISKWIGENEGKLDSNNDVFTLKFEEALLMRTNIEQARAVFQTHTDHQARRVSMLNRLQTLLRQYRQDLAVNDPGVAESEAKILELIHSLSESGSPKGSL